MRRSLIEFFVRMGFEHCQYSHVWGDPDRVKIGKDCSTVNTLFNTVGGTISIGDNTVLGHNCMVLTGLHRFYEGQLASLTDVPYEEFPETPREGNDIRIGEGCYIGSGAIILGGVTIGDRVIVGAGAVVTKDIETGKFVAGVPGITKGNS
ncbi:MAG: acyltransferase [Verrucomicrobiota bacterium]